MCREPKEQPSRVQSHRIDNQEERIHGAERYFAAELESKDELAVKVVELSDGIWVAFSSVE